ncbi:hypothetical protein N7527_004006 [Penicillium freii]|nr:hypothetical protein N7527_004006 [Penicillium freii]
MIYRLGTPQDHSQPTETNSPPHLVYICAPQWTPTGPFHSIVPPSQYVGQATVAQSGRAYAKIRDNPSRVAMKQWSRCSLYTVDSLYAQSAGSH